MGLDWKAFHCIRGCHFAVTHEWLTSMEALRYLDRLPFGEVNDLNLFLFEFQNSPLLVAVPVPSLGMPFLSSVKTGSMKPHPRKVVLAHNSYVM